MDLGLQAKQLAARLNIDPQTLAYWEQGRWLPSLRHLPVVIDWLGYDPRPSEGTLGARLRRLRTARGLSHRQLASVLRVDPSTLISWESGEHSPSLRNQSKLHRLLNSDDR